MRNLLALLALVVIAAVTAGILRGWYTVGLADASPGKIAFRVEIDRIKVGTDIMDGASAVKNCLKPDERPGDKSEASE